MAVQNSAEKLCCVSPIPPHASPAAFTAPGVSPAEFSWSPPDPGWSGDTTPWMGRMENWARQPYTAEMSP